MPRERSISFALLALVFCVTVRSNAAEKQKVMFEADIRPILKAHCFHCHGEGEKLKGDLDLRLRRFMLEKKTDDNESVLTPGKPHASALLKLIKAGEMPKGEKKLESSDIALIEKWIAAGAPVAKEEPKSLATGFQITDDERNFWSFQPIKRSSPGKWIKDPAVRTPLDAFILPKLREQKLIFAPEADRVTLIRRVYFDLLGLPPSPEEIDTFIADASPNAYERLIDRVLELPQYGERWGRHWLDVAGYADSNGYAEADSVRPHAFRYRDYVIRSMNSDKPWDQFIVEQLAGDELAGVTHENAAARAADPEVRELLAATGFLRTAPDGTGDENGDANLARNNVVAETIKIVSTSILGLSVGCAQCHDHRYDPVSQVDYYRMRAIFDPGFDWKNWRNPNQRLVSLYSAEDRKKAEAIEAEARKIDEEANKMRKEFLEKVFEREIAKVPEADRETVKTARNTQRDKRTPEQVALLKKYPSADVQGALDLYDPELNKKVTEKQGEAGKVRATKPPEPFVPAFTEYAGKIPETFLFNRGDHDQPRQKVEPGEMEVLQLCADKAGFALKKESNAPTAGRRLAYARWLTSGRHPLTARVLVNRVWLNHFGRGLVNSPADFGQQGDRPTHPELLDYLASEFMNNGWKLKPLHRLIMTSAVYRQSSRNDASLRADPDNRLLGRMKLHRLDAETLRDSILAVSGKLRLEQFGPALPIAHDDAGRVLVGEQKLNGNSDPVIVEPIGEKAFRRSVYVQSRRSAPLTVLDIFDEPVMSPNCTARQTSTVAPQALMMLNDVFVAEQSKEFAKRLQAENPGNIRAQIARAFRLAYGVAPAETEIVASLVYLAEQTEQIRQRLSQMPPPKDPVKNPPQEPQTLALSSLCQSLFSANRFLYLN